MAVQASKVIEKAPFDKIFWDNSPFIRLLLSSNLKLSLSVRTWEYKGGTSLLRS